jgi:hypothetical protein
VLISRPELAAAAGEQSLRDEYHERRGREFLPASSVLMFVRDATGRPLEILTERHDGSAESIRLAATGLRESANERFLHDGTRAAWLATDRSGQISHVLSADRRTLVA